MVTILLISGLHNEISVSICRFNRRKVASKPRISKPIKKYNNRLGAAKICFASYSCDTVTITSLSPTMQNHMRTTQWLHDQFGCIIIDHAWFRNTTLPQRGRPSAFPWCLCSKTTSPELHWRYLFVSVASTCMHARPSRIEGEYL